MSWKNFERVLITKEERKVLRRHCKKRSVVISAVDKCHIFSISCPHSV